MIVEGKVGLMLQEGIKEIIWKEKREDIVILKLLMKFPFWSKGRTIFLLK